MQLQEYKFDVFADYYQFSLEDEQSGADLSRSWTEKAVRDLIAVTSGAIGIGTVRNMSVLVSVEIHDSQPEEDESRWQHITECSITVRSGRLILLGNDYLPNAPRIKVKPDTYRARVYYGGLNTISDDGLDGEDFYKVVLWSGQSSEPKVIKRRK